MCFHSAHVSCLLSLISCLLTNATAVRYSLSRFIIYSCFFENTGIHNRVISIKQSLAWYNNNVRSMLAVTQSCSPSLSVFRIVKSDLLKLTVKLECHTLLLEKSVVCAGGKLVFQDKVIGIRLTYLWPSYLYCQLCLLVYNV